MRTASARPGHRAPRRHLTAEGLRTARRRPRARELAQTIGRWRRVLAIWLGPEFPGDQTRDDQESLTFDTGVLSEPIEIIGAPRSSSNALRPVVFLAARLNDVRPDGSVSRITYTIRISAIVTATNSPRPSSRAGAIASG